MKLSELFDKQFVKLQQEGKLSIREWACLLKGTCVINEKKFMFILGDSKTLLKRIQNSDRQDFSIKPKTKTKSSKLFHEHGNMDDQEDSLDWADIERLNMTGNVARRADITLKERDANDFLSWPNGDEEIDFAVSI